MLYLRRALGGFRPGVGGPQTWKSLKPNFAIRAFLDRGAVFIQDVIAGIYQCLSCCVALLLRATLVGKSMARQKLQQDYGAFNIIPKDLVRLIHGAILQAGSSKRQGPLVPVLAGGKG